MRGRARTLRRTQIIEHPTPREAWRALLDAEGAVLDATPDSYLDAETDAQRAREAFTDALKRAGS